MKHFENKVAVVTGAASGIGKAIARASAERRMKVVLADIRADAVVDTEKELAAEGAQVISVACDVANRKDVVALANKTLETFGAVDLLFNNAGAGTLKPLWKSTELDWEWVMGVNLGGVIHGISVFVPLMIEQASECHLVNTASAGGLFQAPGNGIYSAAKAAVISLSETLHLELYDQGVDVAVSVLCAGRVSTNMAPERYRPPALSNPTDFDSDSTTSVWASNLRDRSWAMDPAEVAKLVFHGIEGRRLYILTHEEIGVGVDVRARNIAQSVNPTERSPFQSYREALRRSSRP